MISQTSRLKINWQVESPKPLKLRGKIGYPKTGDFVSLDKSANTLHSGEIDSKGYGVVVLDWELYRDVDGGTEVLFSQKEVLTALPLWSVMYLVRVQDEEIRILFVDPPDASYDLRVNGKAVNVDYGTLVIPAKNPGQFFRIDGLVKLGEEEQKLEIEIRAFGEEDDQELVDAMNLAARKFWGGTHELVLKAMKELEMPLDQKVALLEIFIRLLGHTTPESFAKRLAGWLTRCNLDFLGSKVHLLSEQDKKSLRETLLEVANAESRQ